MAKGSKLFIPSQNKLFISLGSHLPNQGEEIVIDAAVGRTVDKGSFVYDRITDKYYVATEGIYDATRDDLAINFNYLGANYSPPGNVNVTTLSDSLPQNISQGTIVQNSATGEYFEALSDVENVTDDTLTPKFVAASVFNSEQGSEWSANRTYNKGQVVLYRGSIMNAKPMEWMGQDSRMRFPTILNYMQQNLHLLSSDQMRNST